MPHKRVGRAWKSVMVPSPPQPAKCKAWKTSSKPCSKTRKAAIARPISVATMRPIFTARWSCRSIAFGGGSCGLRSRPQLHHGKGYAAERWKQARAQQVRIELAHAPRILGEAGADELAQAEAFEEDVGLGRREVLAVALGAAPDGADHAVDGAPVIPGGGEGAQEGVAPSALRLAIGHPVDEEHDVPCLLIHQHVEEGEHGIRQEARLARDLEYAEAEKGVQALAEAKVDERRLDVVGQPVDRQLCSLDAIAVDHDSDQPAMARLLIALQVDRLAQKRIVDRARERLDDGAGAPLGVEHLLPERHRAHALELLVVKRGPGQLLGLEPPMGLDEITAEQRLVSLGSDLHRSCVPLFELAHRKPSAAAKRSPTPAGFMPLFSRPA